MIFSQNAVELSKAEVRALLAHASTDTTRPHLNAVYFDGRDTVAMATDGHRGLVAKGTGEAGQWHTLVPYEALKNASAGKAATLRVTVTGMAGSIVALDKKGAPIATVAYEWPYRESTYKGVTTREHGEFPPLKTVMPRGEKTGSLTGVNAEYLAGVALVQDAAREASDARCVGAIVLPPSDALGPLKFIVGAWTVTIMPMRIGEEAAAMRTVREAEQAIGPTRDQRPAMAREPVKAPAAPALPPGFPGFDAPSFLPGYAPDDAPPGSETRRKAA